MKILYVYRNPRKGFSIGRVFHPIEEDLKKVHCVKSLYLDSVNASLRDLKNDARKVEEELYREHYDIMHITGDAHYLLCFLKTALKRTGTKSVLTVHDLGFFNNNPWSLAKLYHYLFWVRSIKYADLVTTISEKSLKEITDLVRLNKDQAVVIPNAYNPDFVESKKSGNIDTPVLLQINTAPNKNLEGITKAIQGMKCHLRIIGQPTPEQISLLETKNIDFSYVFNLSDSEIVDEYNNCDLVVFASFYEGFGMPIIEGQASGKPVLTSNLSPMKEIAADSAVLVDPSDVTSIRKGIETILTDYDYFKQKGLINAQRFTIGNVASQYADNYQKLLSHLK